MADPTLKDVRELSEWRPPLGVLSVYLGFDAGDRSGSWRTALRNGVDAILHTAEQAEHDRRVALRATADRLVRRYESGERPPPRGEVGFVEVAKDAGEERWWPVGVSPMAPAPVILGESPLIAPLVEVCRRCEAHGVALVSAERVRLLRDVCGELEELDELELSITSLDWRERKSRSTSDPARGQGVSASGHDQYDERLEHNRRRFLEESGHLAAGRLGARGVGDVVTFGPVVDVEPFAEGMRPSSLACHPGGDQDLISAPKGDLREPVAAALRRLDAERDRALAERALGEAQGGSRGAAGVQETTAALGEGRVEHLLFDVAIGDAAEALVRGAIAGSARVTPLCDGAAEILAPAEGVAAILRY